jgi:hypothetical protein
MHARDLARGTLTAIIAASGVSRDDSSTCSSPDLGNPTHPLGGYYKLGADVRRSDPSVPRETG